MTMLLEQLRRDNLGETYAWFPERGNDEGAMILMTAPHYTNQAFYQTFQSLEHFERSSASLLRGPTSLAAIGAWFLSLESYINFALKVACMARREDFAQFKKKDILGRITSLFEITGLEKIEFYRSGILPRLQEFLTVRNELFHDRHFDGELKFSKTKFSGVSYLANQVDVIQASLIAHEVFEAFRYLYAGLDLMPHVNVRRGGGGGLVRSDALYDAVIEPYFRACLKKHGLTTGLDLARGKFQVGECRLAKKGQIGVIIRAIPKEEYAYKANETETRFGADFLKIASDLVIIANEQQYQLANYHRT